MDGLLLDWQQEFALQPAAGFEELEDDEPEGMIDDDLDMSSITDSVLFDDIGITGLSLLLDEHQSIPVTDDDHSVSKGVLITEEYFPDHYGEVLDHLQLYHVEPQALELQNESDFHPIRADADERHTKVALLPDQAVALNDLIRSIMMKRPCRRQTWNATETYTLFETELIGLVRSFDAARSELRDIRDGGLLWPEDGEVIQFPLNWYVSCFYNSIWRVGNENTLTFFFMHEEPRVAFSWLVQAVRAISTVVW